MTAQGASRTSPARLAFAYCAIALLLFAALAYAAVSTKSPTYDEPEHTLVSYVALRDGDFRVEPDHPPLWKYWLALPQLFFDKPINPRLDHPIFRAVPDNLDLVLPWTVVAMYHTPGNDPDHAIAAARLMMLAWAVALGALVARFAYRAAGPLAACVAVTLFALDPNFLAHSPLVKNDVGLAAATTALAYFLYRAAQSLTWPKALAIAVCCAVAVTTKLTGVLTGPIVVLTLAARALLPAPWRVLNRTLATRRHRLAAAAGVCVLCLIVSYTTIWAVYRFRFDPSPDPAVHFNTRAILDREAYAQSAARANHDHRPAFDRRELADWNPGPFDQLLLFSLDHHLLPEPFLEGLLYAHASSVFRYSYLLGQAYGGSRWSYFPIAVLSKTPLTTLAVLVITTIYLLRRRPLSSFSIQHSAFLPLALSSLVLLTSIATSGINIGLRHILPLYPFLFIAAGIAAARLYAFRPKLLRLALPALAICLAAETLTAYPNYIPFFNAAAGGSRGGFRLLGDSNLDWGQDLPLLADWQRTHPHRTLHLAYFGTADPAHYHIRYRNLPQGYLLGPEAPDTLPTTGVLAVSATVLQGLWSPNPKDPTYATLRHTAPTQILGGSIYLFDLGGD